MHDTPNWNEAYSFNKDPLWKKKIQSHELNEVCFYHCDHLGTPQELSNAGGEIVWKAQYKAWGELVTEDLVKTKSDFFENSEIISNNIRFQGQYFDEETGLHYNRHRYYSPNIGRFISKDPIGLLGGHNVYAYAPNPVEWVDSRGLKKSRGKGAGKNTGGDKKKQPCPKDVCAGRNPAVSGRSWQGRPDDDMYVGKDNYKNVVLKKGSILHTLAPHGANTPGYFVDTKQLYSQKGKGARSYNDALQVLHTDNNTKNYPNVWDMRTEVTTFRVTEDICVAKGKAKANLDFGAGGGTKYFVSGEDRHKLLAVKNLIKLK